MEPNLECHVGDVQRCARETQESLTRLRVREESPDGAVQIVLSANGRLDRLTLRPWALRLGPERLAGVIAETIRRAHATAGEQVEAALLPLLRWSHRDVPTGQAFGDLVRSLRRGAGLSQDELAERAGLGVRGLRKIETHQVSSPRPATVLVLADALGLSGPERERFFMAASGAAPIAATGGPARR